MQHRRCNVCQGWFTAQDVEQGLFPRPGLGSSCVRCFVVEVEKRGEVSLPDCFGVGFQGSSMLCRQRCVVSSACMIEFTDKVFDRTAREVDRRPSKTLLMERILRASGRPVHVLDLGPTAARIAKIEGLESRRRVNWVSGLHVLLGESPHVVNLGGGFYVYKDFWDLERDGGTLGVHRAPRLEPVGTILSRLEKESECIQDHHEGNADPEDS